MLSADTRQQRHASIHLLVGIEGDETATMGDGQPTLYTTINCLPLASSEISCECDDKSSGLFRGIWRILFEVLKEFVPANAGKLAIRAATRAQLFRPKAAEVSDVMAACGASRCAFCMNRHNFPVGRIVLPPC